MSSQAYLELDDQPDCPPAMGRALNKDNAAEVIAALTLCDKIAVVLRPMFDRAGLGSLGDAVRIFFGLRLENAQLKYFESFAGLRADVPTAMPGMLPSPEAVEERTKLLARHLLSRFDDLKRLLLEAAK